MERPWPFLRGGRRGNVLAALEIESPEQRAAFLTEAYGGDLSLRSEVEQLLRSIPTAIRC